MMNDGGSAFPLPVNLGDVKPGQWTSAPVHTGISLRDWFAGQALAGMVSREDLGVVYKSSNGAVRVNQPGTGESGRAPFPTMAHPMAETAYRIADAMIKERDGGN